LRATTFFVPRYARQRALALILREQRKHRELIVVGRRLVVQVGVAAFAQGNEVARRFVEHAHIGQMMDLGRAPPAVLAQIVCALERLSATAAKRALSFPFVPVRQLMVRHLASASMSSAAIARMLGTCR